MMNIHFKKESDTGMNIVISFIKKYLLEFIGLFLIAGIVFLFAVSSRGEHMTQQFFDGIRTTPSRSEVVILGIDDKSLQALGAWPWDRKVFADVIKKLDNYGAKVIVYDVLFLEKRSGDDMLKENLLHLKSKVILASKVDKGSYLTSFLVSSSSVNVLSGLSNVVPDIDGKVRSYPLSEMYGGVCVYGLSEQAFRLISFKKDLSQCEKRTDQHFRYPETVTTYSLVDILSDKIERKNIDGKVIFIGSMSLDLEDHFVGMSGEKIGGVQVHASILTSLLNKEGDRILSDKEIATLIILCISLTLLLLYYIKTVVMQIIGMVGLVISVFLISYIFFTYHIIIPAPALLLSVLLSGGYSALVRFIKERKQSEYVQSLFSKYVHKDVLKELMKSKDALNLTGEKRNLTILFSDLRGFTTLSESLSPEELTYTLNGYFSAMTPSILEEHGTIDKFIGDAIMAFWNAPLPVDHHEQHAVYAALRMQEALTVFNKENNTSLVVGIGIHTGNVIVGNVGSKERLNYTVLGDTVNLASRIESLTKKYGVGILITEEVKNKIDDKDIVMRKLDIITVKGKTEATVLYEVMRMNTAKLEIVKEYDDAFLKYQKGDFEKAKIVFKSLSDKGDVPSQKMYERLLTLEDSKDWNGIWHFDEK